MKVRLKSAEDVKLMLLQKGFTQTTFAEHVGISKEYLNRILQEQLFPSAKTAKKITDGLEVDFDDIFFISNGYKSKH